MTFFLVIDLVLRMFPFFSHIFRMFTMLNVVYDHFLTRKAPFFTLFILSRTSDNTASQNIGGTNAWAVSPPQILGGPSPPVPSRSPPLVGEGVINFGRIGLLHFVTGSLTQTHQCIAGISYQLSMVNRL